MFTLKQQAQLSTAKGIEQIEALEKQLRDENPGAFLQPEDLSNRVFFDAPGGHLDNSPLPSTPKHIKPRGDLEAFRQRLDGHGKQVKFVEAIPGIKTPRTKPVKPRSALVVFGA